MNYEIKVYRYTLPLKEKLLIKGIELSERKGFILEIRKGGVVGYGEVAPLPGMSTETLEEVETFLPKVLDAIEDGQLRTDFPPSLEFGIAMALQRMEMEKETSVIVPLTGLIQGSNREAKAKQLVDQGYTDLKLKVGKDPEEDAVLVNSIIDTVEGKATMHVDANQQWNSEQARLFAQKVKDVSYIEEPVKDVSSLEHYPLSLAVDESLVEKPIPDNASVLVLKPSLLGLSKTKELMAQAESKGKKVVISSLFESGIGLSFLANLSVSTKNPAGIDTAKYFEKDLCSLEVRNGAAHSKKITKEDIDWAQLTEVNL